MNSAFRLTALSCLALTVLTICVWPIVALAFFESSPHRVVAPLLPSLESESHSALRLFAASVAWAIGTASIATLIAWPVGRAIGNAMASGTRVKSASFALLSFCASMTLPPWLLYFSLWSLCAPGSMLGDFAAQHGSVGILRVGLLAVSLVLWSTAPVAVIVAVFHLRGEARSSQLELVDGWSRPRRWGRALIRDWSVLSAGFAFVAVTLVCETVVFDLAQVVTYGFELRTLDATGASSFEVLRAGVPAMVLALIGAVFLLSRLTGLMRVNGRQTELPPRTSGRSLWLVVLALSPLLPALLVIAQGNAWFGWQRFVALHGSQAVAMLGVAVASAVVGACVTLSTAVLARCGGAQAKFAKCCTLVLLTLAVSPATIVALLLEGGYNRPELWTPIASLCTSIYDSSVIVVFGLIARTAGWAALAGMLVSLASRGRPDVLVQLDGPALLATWRSLRRVMLLAGSIGFVIAFAASLAELGTTARLAPPAFDSLATSILNAIHYQRPETVLLSMLFLIGLALCIGMLSLTVIRRCMRSPSRAASMLLLCVPWFCVGCQRDPNAPTMPLEVEQSIGSVGRGEGQFVFPRVLASDPRTGDFYVIDKDARVQRFKEDGTFLLQWRMPEWETGRPTGASVSPDGDLVVADTHYYRIVAFSPDGVERWRFGKYGLEEGSFIYPTDIAFGEDGELFVSEYGSNDRIQIFDSRGNFLRSFGSFGSEKGQFARPQSVVWDAGRRELFVADSVNGRVQVFDRLGHLKRVLAEGALAYPYGLDILKDGSLVVTELGAHRVQRIDSETGARLSAGGGRGFAVGQLQYPWGLAARRDGSVAVLDSGNNRVQMVVVP